MRAYHFGLVLLVLASPLLSAKEKPNITPSKDTTYFLGPLEPDGSVDYESAVNTLLKGDTTTENNALVLLLNALGPKPEGAELRPEFYKWLGTEPPSAKGTYLQSSSKFFPTEYRDNPEEMYKLDERLRRRPWVPKDSPKHAEWLKANEKPLAVAREASLRTHYFHPLIVSRQEDGKKGMLIGALLPSVQKVREIASMLATRAMLRVGEGKIDAAFDDALTIHRLGRLMSRGGSLIELLVAIAVDSVAHQTALSIFEHGKVSSDQALAYQAALRKLSPMSPISEKIDHFERAMSLDAMQHMAYDGYESIARMVGGPGDNEAMSFIVEKATLDYASMMKILNKWYDRQVEAEKLPTYTERKAALDRMEDEMKEMRANLKENLLVDGALMVFGDREKFRKRVSDRVANILIGLLAPALAKISDAATREEQIQRNGLIAAGLAAYHADKKAYPKTLADLLPKYLDEVPMDVFNGKPLVYKKTKKGYLFYSVGVNGKNDGGHLFTDSPRGDDVGVRMPRK